MLATLSFVVAAPSSAQEVPEPDAPSLLQQANPVGKDASAPLVGQTESVPATVSGSDLFTGGVTIASSGYSVTCTGVVEYPHYSSGSGGAISKIRITCKGSGLASVNVRVQGLMLFAASPSSTYTNVTFVTRATSDQTQSVTVNGAEKTFYLPKVGSSGGRGTGFWRATGTWYFDAPAGPSTVGSQTVTIFRTI
ncbi:hypothetical protein [Georgenia sp.]